MAISTPSSPPIPELSDVLEKLGLSEYLHVLTQHGFRNWETTLDITEPDLIALHFKLGHRRTLQREIATFRGIPPITSLEPEGASPEPTSLSASALETLTRQTSTPPPREKRRYRRHPRPDNHAPKKPKTAYVNFADQLRTDPEVSQLSFIKIARTVGRRWQDLPPEQKRVWESNAARAMQEYEAQMDEYKKSDNWRRYQNYLTEFKLQQAGTPSGKRPANSRSTTDTSNNTRQLSCASPDSLDSPTSIPSHLSFGVEAEAVHDALTLALSELITLRGEIFTEGVCPYDDQHLPSEELIRQSMYAFIRGTGSLVFIWTYEQADEILERVYRPREKVDAMTLAECFTVAAMGAHYDLDCFPDRIRRVLYASGTLHFHERTARQDYFRTMRLLLSISFYAILEKHMSARYLNAAGLQIARWKAPPNVPISEHWRKLFRSLIFMDSWLSYTLGYASEVAPSDIRTACRSNQDCNTIDELIHFQVCKIGLIAADIAKTLASPEAATRDNVSTLQLRLEAWRLEMPLMLQIPTLTSTTPPDLNTYQRRAIFMVHIMYLGALVLLYRQLLVATAESQQTSGAAQNPSFSPSEIRAYRDECALAAQQISRLLELISFDGTLTKRCWIIIFFSFSSLTVLLFSATTKLVEGQAQGVDADLVHAKACIDKLELCRDFEPLAARYLQILWPCYESLRLIHQRMIGRSKTSIYNLLQDDSGQSSPPVNVSRQEMAPMSEKLSLLLIDPFGRKQGLPGDNSMRRLLNADGSCSVFWWK
ncbi:hypothetical protein ACN47E_007423 [Coniothyrium glycines]